MSTPIQLIPFVRSVSGAVGLAPGAASGALLPAVGTGVQLPQRYLCYMHFGADGQNAATRILLRTTVTLVTITTLIIGIGPTGNVEPSQSFDLGCIRLTPGVNVEWVNAAGPATTIDYAIFYADTPHGALSQLAIGAQT
jgi:hypothetical protein